MLALYPKLMFKENILPYHPVKKKLHYYAQFSVMLWCATYALIKGWNPVHQWADINWLLTYEWGFIKRGAWGSVLAPFMQNLSPAETLSMFETIGSVILFSFIALLFSLALRMQQQMKGFWVFTLFSVVFFSSPYMTMMSNIRNYLDIHVSIMGIGALLAIRHNSWFLAAILLSSAVFIHELVVVIFLPLVVLAILLKQSRNSDTSLLYFWQWPGKSWLPIISPVMVTLFIIFNQQQLDINTLRAAMDAKFLHFLPINEYYAAQYSEMLTYSFFDYLREESTKLSGRFNNDWYQSSILSMFIPTILIGWHLLDGIEKKNRIFLISIACCTCIAPLSLHLIAFDTNRIWAMPLLSCFLTLWLITEYIGHPIQTKKLLFSGFFLLCLWIFYWIMPPFTMFDPSVKLFTSDFAFAAALPVMYICFLISRSLPGNEKNS